MSIDDRGQSSAGDVRSDRVHRLRMVGAAATLVTVVAVVSVVLLQVDDPGRPDPRVVAGPGAERSTDPMASSTTTASPTTSATTTSTPTRFVAVRDNGDLVVIDGTGEKILTNRDFDEDDGPAYGIDAVAFDRRRDRAYFSVCCEPANGVIERIDLTGGESTDVTQGAGGYYPTVSPDGRKLAIGLYEGIGILDLESGDLRRIESPVFVGGGLRPSWSQDGRTLAVEQRDGPRPSVFTMASDATSFAEVRRITPKGRAWALPTFRSDGKLLVVDQCCGLEPRGPARGIVVDPSTGAELASFPYEGPVQDQSYDDTGTYLLYVTTDGTLRWRGAGDTRELGRGYRAADW